MRTTLSASTLSGLAAAMALISFVDAQITQVSLWPLYMGPVIAASWEGGFPEGSFVAGTAGALLVLAALFSGHPYANHYYFTLAIVSEVAALFIMAWYVSRLAATESLLRKLLGKT